MKIQDLAFALVFLFVLYWRNSQLSVVAGLLCLLLAIPLFAFWIFFTAERLVWYAAAFFLYAIFINLFKEVKS